MTSFGTFTGRDDEAVWFDMPDSLRVELRPIHPEDKDARRAGFQELSEESRYQRFLGARDRLSERQLVYLTDLDHVNHFAWVAATFDDAGEEHGLGVARYVRLDESPTEAEVAVVVADAYHGRGIGTLLVQALSVVAADHDLGRLVAYVFADNEPMLRIFDRLGGQLTPDSRGVLRVAIELPAAGLQLSPSAQAGLRDVAREASIGA